MKILETEHEKKSFTITSVFFILLFLLLLFIKLTVDSIPAESESGGGGEITINFGNSEVGSGKNYQSKDLATPKSKTVPVQTVTQVDKVLTQETTEAPAISQTKNSAKVNTPKPAPRPSKSTSDALSSILNGSNKSGDGNDRTAGNKGQLNGDTNARGYTGSGGSGTGAGSGSGVGTGSGYGNGSGNGTGYGNYQLGDRKALKMPQPNYLCQEQGTVVVQISVDRNGKVISANPGVKGTTNTAKCLLDQAKIAAMNTKWQSDNAAPDKQTGKIIYNFKLTQ